MNFVGGDFRLASDFGVHRYYSPSQGGWRDFAGFWLYFPQLVFKVLACSVHYSVGVFVERIGGENCNVQVDQLSVCFFWRDWNPVALSVVMDMGHGW